MSSPSVPHFLSAPLPSCIKQVLPLEGSPTARSIKAVLHLFKTKGSSVTAHHLLIRSNMTINICVRNAELILYVYLNAHCCSELAERPESASYTPCSLPVVSLPGSDKWVYFVFIPTGTFFYLSSTLPQRPPPPSTVHIISISLSLCVSSFLTPPPPISSPSHRLSSAHVCHVLRCP